MHLETKKVEAPKLRGILKQEVGAHNCMPKSWLSSKYYAELDSGRGCPMPDCGTSNHAVSSGVPRSLTPDFQFIVDEPKA